MVLLEHSDSVEHVRIGEVVTEKGEHMGGAEVRFRVSTEEKFEGSL